jgi:adenylate cyclase
MKSKRRLAAIMFCDIVGFTAMMEEDEEMARGNVEHFKEILEQFIDTHHGEVQQYYGDGCLCLFNTATDAVRCALKLQKELQQKPSVPVRIGIHMGEVLVENSTIYGSGVNLASRIESLGKAGAVLFSKSIYNQIQNHAEFETAYLGSFAFKNIEKSTEVFALNNKGLPVPSVNEVEAKLKYHSNKSRLLKHSKLLVLVSVAVFIAALVFWSINKSQESDQFMEGQSTHSIAVMPFDNFNSDEEHQFFAQAIADEIRAQLLNIKDLKVISRASSNYFKGKGLSAQQIGSELNVNYLLGGRVQRAEKSVRISVELSNTINNELEWAPPPFERSLTDIFSIQNEIAESIVDQLSIRLTIQERSAIDKVPTKNAEAYEAFLQGQELLNRGGGQLKELNQAIFYFEKAIDLDEDFDRAYLGLAKTHIQYLFWGRKKPVDAINDALDAVFKATDTESAEYIATIGFINFFRFQGKTAKIQLEKAVEMSPNNADAIIKLAWISLFNGDPQGSKDLMEKAHVIDPFSTFFSGSLGLNYFYRRSFDEGIKRFEELLLVTPDDDFIKWMHGHLCVGRADYAKAVQIFQDRKAGHKTNWMLAYALGKNGQKEEAQNILDFLLNKRETGYVPAFMIATVYMGLDNYEEALSWLEQDIADGGQGHFIWGLKSDPIFDPVRTDPRFVKILEIIK